MNISHTESTDNRSHLSKGEQARRTKARKTFCDKCRKKKSDCIWVRFTKTATESILCGLCRRNYLAYGAALENCDQDYPEIAL